MGYGGVTTVVLVDCGDALLVEAFVEVGGDVELKFPTEMVADTIDVVLVATEVDDMF